MPIIPRFESNIVAQPVRGGIEAATIVPEAIAGFGQSLEKIGALLSEAEIAKNRALNQADASIKLSQVRAKVEEGIRLLELQPDPRTHRQNAMQLFRDAGEEAMATAANEDVRLELGPKLNALGTEVFRETGRFENRLLIDQSKAALQTELPILERNAVEAVNPLDRQQYETQVRDAIQARVDTGVLSAATGVQEQQAALKRIRMGRARQDAWRDPESFLSRLQEAEFSDLTPDEIQRLNEFAESRIRTLESQRRMAEAAEERETRRIQEENYRGLLIRMRNREDVSDTLIRMGETREINAEQLRAGLELNRVASRTLDRPSNPAIYERIALDVHGTAPRTTEAEIDRLVRNETLNIVDGLALKDRLAINRDKMKANPDLTRRHAQAEQLLASGLTTRSPFEPIDERAQKAKTMALMELTRRSSLFDGQEDPLAVAREILPHFQQILEGQGRLEEDGIRTLLLFQTPQELEAAKATLPRGVYETQRKLFLDLDKRMQERIGIENRRKGTTTSER